MRRTLHYWAPVVAWMLVIFAASSRPRIPYQNDVPDWFSHALVYLVLALLTARALSAGRAVDLRLAVLTFVFCVSYGVSDELHQAFVPGRHPDVWDVVKDAIGTLIGLGLYGAWPRRLHTDEARPS